MSPRCGMGSVSGPPRIEAVKKDAGDSGFLGFLSVEPNAESLAGEPGLPGQPRGLEERGRLPRGEPWRGEAGGSPAGIDEKGRGDWERAGDWERPRGDACLERRCTWSLSAAICASASASLRWSASTIGIN